MTDITTGAPAPEPAAEQWIWVGRRMDRKGAMSAVWQDPAGNWLWYKTSMAGLAIGATYEAQVIRGEDSRVTLRGRPRFTGGGGRHPDAAQWEAQELADKAEARRRSREKDAARNTALDEALEPLLDIAAGLRTGADRDAFAAHVLNAIHRSWATRGMK